MSKRSSFYLLYDSLIEATARANGVYSQDLYIEGQQLIDRVKYIGGVEQPHILEMLRTCAGFRKLVHSIGVTAATDESESVVFTLDIWGKTNKYESGTHFSIECPANNEETLIVLEDIDWSNDDDVLGKMSFEFQHAGQLAKASIKFYLNEEYQLPLIAEDEPLAFDSTSYQNMIANSLLTQGNNYRLKKAIAKARSGEHITVAYIGGSITQGAGAKPLHENCYAYQSYLAFQQIVGKEHADRIHFVKAGVGGTPSQLGLLRYERDILRDHVVKPDIVIIEFAVNDADDETNGISYESLVLKALTSEHTPAVVLLFSVFSSDWNLQDRLAPIGYHYQLPMVSVKDAVSEQFSKTKEQGKVVSKRQYFYDIYHPTNIGHRIMADSLAHLFKIVDSDSQSAQDIVISNQPAIGNDFVHIQLLDRHTNTHLATIHEGSFTELDRDLQAVEMDTNPQGTPQFPYNWMHVSDTKHRPFEMSLQCKHLMLIFKDSGRTDFGKANVYINGELVKTLDPKIVSWTHCHATLLIQGSATRDYQVKIEMVEEDQDKHFTILGFGVVE